VRTLTGKRVLVTGGAGFIGSHLVDRIITDAPADLVVVDNLFLGREDNLAAARKAFPALRFVREDASDYDAMARIATDAGTEVIFSLAVIPLPTSLERPRWTIDVNVAIATVAGELIREGRAETLIHFSSSEAYGSAQYAPMDEAHPLAPCTPYAASKAAGDHVVLSYCETFGIDAAIVRPFNNYGPRQNDGAYAGIIPIVVRRALRGEGVTISGDGEQTRDFTFVRDTAEAAVRVYGEPATRARVLNVATGREVSINDLVRRILDVMESTAPISYGPPRPGDVRRHCGDVARLRVLTGFEPGPMTEAALRETVRWYADTAVSNA
jgi:UDP-glucose 4-epimerase